MAETQRKRLVLCMALALVIPGVALFSYQPTERVATVKNLPSSTGALAGSGDPGTIRRALVSDSSVGATPHLARQEYSLIGAIAPLRQMIVGQDPQGVPEMGAFVIGDRIKITVFEEIGNGRSGGDAAVSNLVERPELSGEYSVKEDGTVFLPLLGRFSMVAASEEELKAKFVEELGSKIGGAQINVGFQIMEREPVYVSGMSRSQAVKHVPGMTVLHALSLVGLGTDVSADQWRQLDLARERERLSKSRRRTGELMARHDVLVAEQSGAQAFASGRLADQVGDQAARELIAEAQRLRRLEQQQLRADQLGLEGTVAAAAAEVERLKQSLPEVERSHKDKTERVRILSEAFDRGRMTLNGINAARNELISARERLDELRASIARAERALLQARQGKARADVEAELARERQIREIRNSLSEEAVTQTTLGQALSALGGPGHALGSTKESIGFVIMRRGPAGLQRIQASELSPLQPGDILKFVPDDRGAVAGSSLPRQSSASRL